MKREPGEIKGTVRAKQKPYMPVVLSRREIDLVLAHLSLPYDLIVKLLYGSGLRLFECLNLRISDFDLEGCMLTVHDGKGKKDRSIPLPETVIPEIRKQFDVVADLHEKDLNTGYAGAFLKGRLDKKYKNAAKELVWQWIFPALSLTTVRATGEKNDITSMKGMCSEPSRMPPEKRNCSNALPRIRFDTVLQLTCCRPTTTSERSRISWGTAISGQL